MREEKDTLGQIMNELLGTGFESHHSRQSGERVRGGVLVGDADGPAEGRAARLHRVALQRLRPRGLPRHTQGTFWLHSVAHFELLCSFFPSALLPESKIWSEGSPVTHKVPENAMFIP